MKKFIVEIENWLTDERSILECLNYQGQALYDTRGLKVTEISEGA